MGRTFRAFAAVSALVAAGCGIPDDKPIVELSASEQEKLCESVLPTPEGETVDCDGASIEINDLDACVDGFGDVAADCGATVADWLDCNETIAADPCVVLSGLPSACVAYAACLE